MKRIIFTAAIIVLTLSLQQVTAETAICTNSEIQRYASVSGSIIVWEDNRNGNLDIYGYDTDSNTQIPICTNSAVQFYPSISGNIVVWQDFRNGNPDIYGYNIETATEFAICTDSSLQECP